MNLGHDSLPENLGKGGLSLPEFGIVIIPHPGGGGVIVGIAGKPDVVVFGSGSRFTGNLRFTEIDRLTGSLGHHIFHGAG